MEGQYTTTHKVTNVDELEKALANMEDGDIIKISKGTYDMTKEVNGQKGSSFIVTKNNVKIIGEEGTVITASTNGGNGTYNGINQMNTVTISGDNAQLSGLTVQSIQILNENSNLSPKALEVTNVATNFTMDNCVFEPNKNIEGFNSANYGGQVAINTSKDSNKDTIKVTNCTFDGAMLDLRTPATITGNTFKANANIGLSVRFRNQFDGTGNNKAYDDIVIDNNSYSVEPGSAPIGTGMKTVQDKLDTLGFTNVNDSITAENNAWLHDWIQNYSYVVYNK